MDDLRKIKTRLGLNTTHIVMPASIRYSKLIKPNLKIFYAVLGWVILNYQFEEITNPEISYLIDKPLSTIEQWLMELENAGFIFRDRKKHFRKIKILKYDIVSVKGGAELKEAGYYSLIPGNVIMTHLINFNEKMLYGEILALTRAVGYCFADYKTLAALCNTSVKSLYRWLDKLIEFNFVKKGESVNKKPLLYVKFSPNIKQTFVGASKRFPKRKDGVVLNETALDDKTKAVLDDIFNKIK